MNEQNEVEIASCAEGATARVISTSDMTDKAKDDNSASSIPVISSKGKEETPELAALLEELQKLKTKLSQVDERTQRHSLATGQANFSMQTIVGPEVMDSIISSGRDPTRVLHMNNANEKIFETILSSSKDIDFLRRYNEIDRRRLDHRHSLERAMQMRFEAELENYYANLLVGNENSKSQENESAIKNNISAGLPSNQGKPSKFNRPSNFMRPMAGRVGINRVEWSTWKSRLDLPSTKSYVIDVLVEEPNLSFQKDWNLVGTNAPSADEDEQIKSLQEFVVTGEKPLPERIRIFSPFINDMIKSIDDDVSWSNYGVRAPPPPRPGPPVPTQPAMMPMMPRMPPSRPPGPPPPPRSAGKLLDRPFIMVRPYKFLTFHHDAIQKWLKDELGDIEDRASTPPAPQNTGMQEDDQKLDEVSHPSHDSISETTNLKVAHIRCLLDFMGSYISTRLTYIESITQGVSFTDLWHIFKPGTEVIEAGDKHKQCYRVVKVTSPKHKVSDKYYWYFRSRGKAASSAYIHCVYVDFDGSLIGPVSIKFEITRYEGLRDIRSLPIYPLRCESDGVNIRKELIKRGNKFLRVIHRGHMHYNGLTVDSRDEIDSQVVIDFTEAFASREGDKNSGWKPRVEIQVRAEDEKLKKGRDSDSDSDSDTDSDAGSCAGECCFGEQVINDNHIDAKQNEKYLSGLLDNTEEGHHPAPLEALARPFQKDKEMYVSESDLVIMSYRVFGFILRSRSWAKLDVEELMELDEYRRRREIEDSTGQTTGHNAFDNLVFPKDGLDRKKIVRSLVAQHFRDKESTTSRDEQSDIIRGKGKGLIILLHGAPGVGKTSTAEGIAELFNKPLFQITCGDLGTTAKEVEAALETNFSLANKWGSILLLDEADVFLARRTPHDFQRNGLVAVFLRVLEYYAGILFLTTNRIGDFDEAFSSRIHISLHYPALDYDSSVDIFDLNWRLIKARFKNKGRDLEIDESKITGSLAEYWHKHPNARWNGRQIRNACQTALALAEFEAQTNGEDGATVNPNAKVHLGVSHIKTVSDAYLEFIKYLQDVRDADQERYAYLLGIRRNESINMPPENPLAYGPSTPLHRGQVSRLAEHRAKSAARYNRSDQGLYPPSNPYANPPNDRPSHHYGNPLSGGVGLPYQQFAQQVPGPYQPPPSEPQAQRGWNPGPMGGSYAGQETQFQQGSSPGTEIFGSQQYGQNTQYEEKYRHKRISSDTLT
ncbi:hypothetical protein F5Y08DRAFT_304074 [Xylaria arbuscula]|nr:hypothetical protein F5Y08DRAFT_304074 [Xylaria arbuscula]